MRRPDDRPPPAVRAAVDAGADRFVARLVEPGCASPPSPATPRTARTCAGPPSGSPQALRDTGFPTVEVWETAGRPRSSPSGPRRPGRAHRARLRPPRRAAAPPASVGAPDPFEPLAATGCTRAARPTTRARCSSTPSASRPTSPPPAAPPGRQPQAAHRGRGGVRLAALPRPAPGARRPLAAATPSSSPTPACGPGHPDRLHRHARPGRLPDRPARPDQDIHSGSFGGAVPNPLTELRAAARPAARRRRARDDPRLLRRLRRAHRPRARALRRAALRRGRPGCATPRSTAPLGEAGYSAPWSASGPARPPRSTASAAATRARGTRRSSRPRRTLKLSFRLVAGQDPRTSSGKFEAWLDDRRARRHRRDRSYWYGAGVRPCLTPLDHPALGSVVRAMGTRLRPEVLFTREGGSGPAADLQDVLAPRSCSSASPCPTTAGTRRTRRSRSLLLKGAETAALPLGRPGPHPAARVTTRDRRAAARPRADARRASTAPRTTGSTRPGSRAAWSHPTTRCASGPRHGPVRVAAPPTPARLDSPGRRGRPEHRYFLGVTATTGPTSRAELDAAGAPDQRRRCRACARPARCSPPATRA